MKIGILEAADFSKAAISVLKKAGSVSKFDGRDLKTFLADKEILFVRLNKHINAEFLSHAKKLKFICSPTTGLNHIDTGYCQNRGIKIISLKGETAFLKTIRATPEHTLGLIISLYRNYAGAFLNSKNSDWNRDKYRGYEIYGSKIGIIGLGRVGSLLAKYLKAMDADVSFYDTDLKKSGRGLNRCSSISELIRKSDTVVLCSSYDSETGSIINKKEIEAMKGKFFVNTARAELSDENYLLNKAGVGHFKGIAIDVIQNEQAVTNLLGDWLKITGKYNVVITPHTGGATFTSMARTEEFICSKLLNILGR